MQTAAPAAAAKIHTQMPASCSLFITFPRVIHLGIHICKLLVAIQTSQERPYTSFAPNQNACTNVVVVTNCTKPDVHPHNRLSFASASPRSLIAFLALSTSTPCVLNACRYGSIDGAHKKFWKWTQLWLVCPRIQMRFELQIHAMECC